MPPATTKHQQHPGWSALAILFMATAGAAALGGLGSATAPDFYAQLVRPAWAPPAAVFGPVWTMLYLMMTLAVWLVVNQLGWQHSRLQLTVYFAQLAINALWSWLFFRWHSGTAALLDIALLWLAVVHTIVLFRRVRPGAALLLLPYLLWTSFAAALTWSVVSLNPQLL